MDKKKGGGKKEERYVPGAEPKEVKKGSRRKKATKDEPTEAGPSSSVPHPSPALPGHGPGLSTRNTQTPTGTIQTPAATGIRQSDQTPKQPAQATSSSTRPTQSLAPTGPHQVDQSSKQPRQSMLSTPNNTPNPTESLPDRSLADPNKTKEIFDPDQGSHGSGLSKKESAAPSIGNQEFVRLRGQPPRPARVHQESSTRVSLATNYFRLTHPDLKRIGHYGIAVSPEAKGSKLTQIIKIALNHGDFKKRNPFVVTDFSAIMLSMGPIEPKIFKIRYHSELEAQASDNAKEYEISLILKGFVDFKNPLDSTQTSSDGLPIEQALDIVLGHHRKLSDNISVVNKRKAFSVIPGIKGYSSYPLDQDNVLTALRGYISSVRMSESAILVNINVSHGAFYEAPQPLGRVIRWLENLNCVHQSKISGLLRGLRVNSSHIPRAWSIWGYPRDGDGKGYMLHPPRFRSPGPPYTPDNVEFFHETVHTQALTEKEKKDAIIGHLRAHDDGCSCPGTWLTVTKYFSTVRREPIPREYLRMPVVNVGSNKRPTYLPSHLCEVRPGQLSNLKLEGDRTKEMIKFAVRDPFLNSQSIMNDGFETLGLKQTNEKLMNFKIVIDKRMVRLWGRVLQQPKLYYYNPQKVIPMRGSSWNMLAGKFRKPKMLNDWACLRIQMDGRDGSIFQGSCAKSLEDFQKHLETKGIIAEKNNNHDDLFLTAREYVSHDTPGKLENFFKSSLKDYNVSFLLVVLPKDVTSELYNSIKRYGDVKYGIHTVCVKADKFGDPRYDENVALKINLKLGGINHILDDDSYGLIYEGETMVVGIDVTHPPPGNDGAPSVAAMVASQDKELSQWPADLRINERRQEMVNLLQEMLVTRLQHFKEKNSKCLPKNILIYRDGVGEGQYKTVLEEELPRMRAACHKVYGMEYELGVYPRISLIVVGKRHHTRFYRTKGIAGPVLDAKSGNPPFGTLVDKDITQDSNWDFFLQSHTAITGTARPAHYFVLLDEIFRALSNDPVGDLERLTYNMCYLYGKATTSVSIPPPVYYADKACDRGRRYLSKVFEQSQQRDKRAVNEDDVKIKDRLNDTMFYI